MTVMEVFDSIDLDILLEESELSNYHDTTHTFVNQVWHRDVDTLSKKQVAWLDKIETQFAGRKSETFRN